MVPMQVGVAALAFPGALACPGALAALEPHALKRLRLAALEPLGLNGVHAL